LEVLHLFDDAMIVPRVRAKYLNLIEDHYLQQYQQHHHQLLSVRMISTIEKKILCWLL
jgi:hypothetical protein